MEAEKRAQETRKAEIAAGMLVIEDQEGEGADKTVSIESPVVNVQVSKTPQRSRMLKASTTVHTGTRSIGMKTTSTGTMNALNSRTPSQRVTGRGIIPKEPMSGSR